MAYLNLNTLEPVNFGGRECMPNITTELKMRLSEIKKYDGTVYPILAAAFPNDEEYVKNFLPKMTTIDIELLHGYLLGGPTMVESIKKRIEGALSEVNNG